MKTQFTELINYLKETAVISDMDCCFADFAANLLRKEIPEAPEEFYLAAIMVSAFTTARKHTCLELNDIQDKALPEVFPELLTAKIPAPFKFKFPPLAEWLKILKTCTAAVGAPGDFKPLIIEENGRLYLQRYWDYENRLASMIARKISEEITPVNEKILRESLKRYFPGTSAQPDWQKAAAFTAVNKNFCIISGGPGTGKTTTAAKIIGLILEQQEKDFKIILAAPTGKAAARLKDSLKESIKKLDCPSEIKNKFPAEALTIHRLLGYIPDSPFFRHDNKNPIAADMLLIDEASMIPLALMEKLFDAIRKGTRVILLGDKDQLASVEAGSVLNDISDAAGVNCFSDEFRKQYNKFTGEDLPSYTAGKRQIENLIIGLNHSYRFDNSKGIGSLSRAVNNGDFNEALKIIRCDSSGEIEPERLPSRAELQAKLKNRIISFFTSIASSPSVDEAYKELQKFRILLGAREGFYGALSINIMAEEILKNEGLLEMNSQFYHGRPVLINKNDYKLNLFNGDNGLIWREKDGRARAYFMATDGKLKSYSPLSLPEHETSFAMSVHKTQGSEFETILLILPDNESKLLTRELVYTAITRAKKKAGIWYRENTLRKAVENITGRSSGLKDKLIQEYFGELALF